MAPAIPYSCASRHSPSILWASKRALLSYCAVSPGEKENPVNTDSLLRRFRQQKETNGGDVDLAAIEVLTNATKEELHELAFYAIKELDRRTLRTFAVVHLANPPIPVGNSGKRVPLMEWTLSDVNLAMEFFKSLERTARQTVGAFAKVQQILGPRQRIKDCWALLNSDTQETLTKFGGLKRLAA